MRAVDKLARMALILVAVIGASYLSMYQGTFLAGAAFAFALVAINETYQDWAAARRVERWRNKRQRKKAA